MVAEICDRSSEFERRVLILADQALVNEMKVLLNKERHIGEAILLVLQEIKVRRLYAGLGYGSLFEMLVKHYSMSETAAYQRINALKLIEAVPEAKAALLNNELNLSSMAKAQSFIGKVEAENKKAMNEEEKREVVNLIKGKTSKETETILAELNPLGVLPKDREKPLGCQKTLLQITVDEETLGLLKELKLLLSHQVPDGNYNELLKLISRKSLEQLRKKPAKPNDSIGNCSPDTKSASDHRSAKQCVKNGSEVVKRSRHISSKVRQQVFERAGGVCEFIGNNGQRCQSRYQLEVDHLEPYSQGGSNGLANLSLKCRVHNCYRTKETHGYWYQKDRIPH